MKPLRFTLVTLAFAMAFAAFAGCATAPFTPVKAKPATAEQLRRMGAANNGLDCLLYKGSDAQFHYFHHARMGGGGTYRIPRSEWKPARVFPIGQERGDNIHQFQHTLNTPPAS